MNLYYKSDIMLGVYSPDTDDCFEFGVSDAERSSKTFE